MAKTSLIRVAKQIRKTGRILGTNKFTTKLAKTATKLAVRQMYDGIVFRKGGRIRKCGCRR